jgi:hypothetical protein
VVLALIGGNLVSEAARLLGRSYSSICLPESAASALAVLARREVPGAAAGERHSAWADTHAARKPLSILERMEQPSSVVYGIPIPSLELARSADRAAQICCPSGSLWH